MVQRLFRQGRSRRAPVSLPVLVLLSALVACGPGVTTPTVVPTTSLASAVPTATEPPTATPISTATLAAIVPTVIPSPSVAPSSEPAVTPIPTLPTAASSATTTPWPIPGYVSDEIAAFFAEFYQARTLRPGGAFDIARVRDMTGIPYRHYTVSLLERDQADADAGRLLSVTYGDIATSVADWQPQPDGTGTVVATVSRTLRETRADGARAPQTATLRFKLSRTLVRPGSAAWTVWDYYDQAVGAWVSQGVSFGGLSPEEEIAAFFGQFYAAREVQAGQPFDPLPAIQHNRFAYAAYQGPQLERQRDEVASGALISVSYSDIQVKLIAWDAFASQHGGMATLDVTRIRRIVRPGGSETTRQTVRFRVHRHLDLVDRSMWEPRAGGPLWYAIDFVDPGTGQWASSGGWDWLGDKTTDPLPVNDFFG